MEALFKLAERAIEHHVSGLFFNNQPACLKYHNLEHTRSVVQHSLEIAGYYPLTRQELFMLTAAAWFHDTGQLFTTPDWHEAESVRLANSFLLSYPEITVQVTSGIDCCILATRMPQNPHSLIDCILCDADLYHLGTKDFEIIDNKVREEAIARGMPTANWDVLTLQLLTRHQFHTKYCRQHLAKGKLQNIAIIQQRIGS